MMQTTRKTMIEVAISSFWHAGSGGGSGPSVDSSVARTPAGLPFLPGRTLKGLLREAAEILVEAKTFPGEITGDAVDEVFGTRATPGSAPGMGRFETTPGAIELDNALLGRTHDERVAWERWAARCGDQIQPLFSALSATALDGDGVVRRGSLRTIEVATPVTLYAPVSSASDAAPWRALLERACVLVRGLGVYRNRGLGRCRLRCVDVEEAER